MPIDSCERVAPALCPWQIGVVVFVGPGPVRFLFCFSAGWRSAYLVVGVLFVILICHPACDRCLCRCYFNCFSCKDRAKTEVKLRFDLCRSNPFARNEGRSAKTEVKLRFIVCWSNPFARNEGRSAKTEVKLRFLVW